MGIKLSSRIFGSPITLLSQHLYEIPDMSRETVGQLAELFTTSSNVLTISARGWSRVTGLEVEIIAVVDRSTVPIRIIEYREQ